MHRPLDDVVVVRAPVDIADETPGERVAGLAVERPPRQRPQPEIPVEPGGHRLALRSEVQGDG